MKSKFTKVLSPEKEPEDNENIENEESSDVEVGGPSIALAKKNRMVIIALSSVLITVVVYFIFFKSGDDEKKPEKLQEVSVPPTRNVAMPDDGKSSPFEIDAQKEEPKEDVELLDKPAVPEIPSLPDGGVMQQDGAVVPPSQNTQQINLGVAPGQPLLPGVKPVQINPITPSDPGNAVAEPKEDKKKDVNPRYAPIVVFSGGGAAPDLGVGYGKNIVNLNEDPIGQLEKSKVSVKTTYVGDRTHAITQGKLITAVLETAINTQIPGFVRGIVSRDVYAESGSQVLIPKGSRLYGAYSSQITRGQGRVNISWTRLIRPDGVDLNISFNASDQFGRAGIPGDVDNKYGSIIAGSLLTSILAVGGAAAANKVLNTNNNSVSTTTSNGAVTTTGDAANQAIADVTKTIVDTTSQIVNNALNTAPVITIAQGTKITVIVNADMNLPYIVPGH